MFVDFFPDWHYGLHGKFHGSPGPCGRQDHALVFGKVRLAEAMLFPLHFTTVFQWERHNLWLAGGIIHVIYLLVLLLLESSYYITNTTLVDNMPCISIIFILQR